MVWISPTNEFARRHGSRHLLHPEHRKPLAELRIEVTKMSSPFSCSLLHSFVHASPPNLYRKGRPRFASRASPETSPSFDNLPVEFTRALSCSRNFSRRKPSFLVPSPPSPASSALFRPWSHRAAPGHRRLKLPIPWMRSQSSDRDPTDENKTYPFDVYFSKEPLCFLESNPQSKTYGTKYVF